jgi:hypothetical protein
MWCGFVVVMYHLFEVGICSNESFCDKMIAVCDALEYLQITIDKTLDFPFIVCYICSIDNVSRKEGGTWTTLTSISNLLVRAHLLLL